MSVTYSDFIEFAKKLTLSDELSRRSAISRSYYGCYHAAVIFSRLRDVAVMPSNQKGGVHQKLIAALQANTDEKIRAAGDQLQRMKLKRNRADYELDGTVGEREATKAIVACDILVNKFRFL
jgi:uncharacterized protein (UPF0332 family)